MAKKKKNNNNNNLQSFREVIILMIRNSILLTPSEKDEFVSMTPELGLTDLRELFHLLVGARHDVDDILRTIARDFPEVGKQLSNFQRSLIQKVFKGQRDLYKNLLPNNQ